jgi:hypothetical protein
MIHGRNTPRSLTSAKKAKQDEFYTQLGDISNEVKHYKEQLHGKTIFCNCDDPFESNFFKYFALNFNTLRLKKLIATSYIRSPIVGGQLPLVDIKGLKSTDEEPYVIEINAVPDQNADGATDITDVVYLLMHDANSAHPLKGDAIYSAGDFRSDECVQLLKQADVVVTNPPFSLFREFVTQLVNNNKDFIIIGNKNAITYKEVFKLIKDDKLRTGYRNINSDMWFEVPDGAAYEKIEDGRKVKHIMAMWLTTLDVKKHNENMPLYKKYSANEYPTYDNYEAIEVNKVADIPVDYFGFMGVPITFIDKFSPNQFEIFGMAASAGYDPEVVGLEKNDNYKDARPLIDGKNTYARIFIKRKI